MLHHGHLRAVEHRRGRQNALQVGRVVQRRQRRGVSDGIQHPAVHKPRRWDVAAVHHLGCITYMIEAPNPVSSASSSWSCRSITLRDLLTTLSASTLHVSCCQSPPSTLPRLYCRHGTHPVANGFHVVHQVVTVCVRQMLQHVIQRRSVILHRLLQGNMHDRPRPCLRASCVELH